jgi:hypothetical protein
MEGQVLVGPQGARYPSGTPAQFVSPDPLDRQRYVLSILPAPGSELPVDAVHLTLKGWYDYALWRSAPQG